MTSGDSAPYSIRKATLGDLDSIKAIADRHKVELGFVRRPTLALALAGNEVLVAEVDGEVVGFVHYHHRRDQQTTLYNIVVTRDYRQRGIGAALLATLCGEARTHHKDHIILKCPSELDANGFYADLGYSLLRTERGKHRPLNIWALAL